MPEGAVAPAVADTHYMLTTVNELLKNTGRTAIFKIRLVALAKETRLSGGRFVVQADKLLDDAENTDLVIIPAITGDLQKVIEKNARFIPWIVQQYKNGAEIASLCTGAFLLASTGLLDGKMCSTHWMFANEFRKMFPRIHMVDEKIITGQKGLFTSGGANSYWNLLIYLVEKFTDRQTAVLTAKYFLVETGQEHQSPFIIFKGQKDHEDDVVKRAQLHIEQSYREKITVDQLSELLGIGRRSLERRFRKATSNTVIEYIQRVKVEATKMQLETGIRSIREVMREVGYADIKAFREVFRKFTGMSPVDYKDRYNKTHNFLNS